MTWDRDINQAFRFHEELKVMDEMNKSGLWSLNFRYYEHHKAGDDKSDSVSYG